MRGIATLAFLGCVFACGEPPVAPTRQPTPPQSSEETPPPIQHPERVQPPVPNSPPTILAIDTHVDTTQRMLDAGDDITRRFPTGHLDIPRMREGGLAGAFFSIWVDPEDHQGEGAWRRTLALIAAVQRLADDHPSEVALCTTAACVRATHQSGKTALLMGVEGAHGLGTDEPTLVLERLREVYRRGVRYMTITWSNDNPLGHSSTGRHPERGLTPLGRRVLAEMNRLGMIVDVSHVSDATFNDILDIAQRPVFASHSSARALSNHPRNVTDEMIRRVGQNGGAVCVNYYSQYIDAGYRARRRRIEQRHPEDFARNREEYPRWQERRVADFELARRLDPALDPPTVETLGAHFEHIARLIGPEGVCLGSDFDGVSDLPLGLQDVSELPALRRELARRSLPVALIFGANVLRILEANEVDR